MENQIDKEKLASFARMQDGMIAKNTENFNDNDYLSGYTRNVVRLRDYTLKEVDNVINSGSLTEQRRLSRNYFQKDGLYKRILIHYSTLLTYAGMLVPYPRLGEKLSSVHVQKKYYSALNYLEKLNLPELFQKMSLAACIDGTYYGVIKQLSKNEAAIIDLPVSYCRSCFKDIYGNDIIDFDVTYFDSIVDKRIRKEALAVFPESISSFYKRYLARKTTNSWCRIGSNEGLCFSFFEDGAPQFLNVIPATIEYDQAVETERERDLEEIRKILVQHMPHLNDGELVFQPEEALEMHRGAVDMLKGNANLSVLTSYADVEAIVSKTSSDAVSNNLEKMLQNVYSEANVSTQIFSPTGSQALTTSLTNDTAFMMILGNKYSRFITKLVNDLFGNSNISFKYMVLPISHYNRFDFVDSALKLAQNGYSFLMPSVALGLGQRDLLSIKELENEVLNLQDKLIPLSSSYTQSASSDEGGRPTKTVDEKKASTVAKEESIDNQGGSKTQ